MICSIQAKHYQILLGKNNLMVTGLNEQIFDVEQIFIHPDYQNTDHALYNDIGEELITFYSIYLSV